MVAYLTVPEVAEMARCHHNSVRRAIAAGKLRAYTPANRLLIRREDAEKWIEGAPADVHETPAPRARKASRRRATVATSTSSHGW